ncbi:MAG: hypothetical protein ACYCXG_11825 [Acidiferrobacter sp.]
MTAARDLKDLSRRYYAALLPFCHEDPRQTLWLMNAIGRVSGWEDVEYVITMADAGRLGVAWCIDTAGPGIVAVVATTYPSAIAAQVMDVHIFSEGTIPARQAVMVAAILEEMGRNAAPHGLWLFGHTPRGGEFRALNRRYHLGWDELAQTFCMGDRPWSFFVKPPA